MAFICHEDAIIESLVEIMPFQMAQIALLKAVIGAWTLSEFMILSTVTVTAIGDVVSNFRLIDNAGKGVFILKESEEILIENKFLRWHEIFQESPTSFLEKLHES